MLFLTNSFFLDCSFPSRVSVPSNMISYFIISFTCGWCLYWILYSGSFGSSKHQQDPNSDHFHHDGPSHQLPMSSSFFHFLDDDEEEEEELNSFQSSSTKMIRKAVFVSQVKVCFKAELFSSFSLRKTRFYPCLFSSLPEKFSSSHPPFFSSHH